MTFPELMSFIAFMSPVLSSLETGWKTGRGVGLLIGFIVGLLFGVGSFLGVRVFCSWASRSTAHPGAFWIGLSWLLGAALLVSIGGVATIAYLFTQFVIHHVAA